MVELSLGHGRSKMCLAVKKSETEVGIAQNMWTIKFDCYKHNYDELSKELDSKVYIYMYFYVVMKLTK